MSTPQAKRRRLNEATKTLQKPFKSPFRTPLRPNTSSDPPSSDPPETYTPGPVAVYEPLLVVNNKSAPIPTTTIAPAIQPPTTPAPVKKLVSKALASRPSLLTPSRTEGKKAPSKPSIARETMQLRNELQMLKQAQTLATSTKDDDLVVLIDRWRSASRAAAEELFGTTRDRVNRMGGVGAWKEREKESKDRQLKWDQEELEAQREKMEEARENGEVSEEAYDRYAEMSDEKVEEEKETFKGGADDDVSWSLDNWVI